MPAKLKALNRPQGFTLIEVVSAMVLSALALAALTPFFIDQSSRAVAPMFEIRAAKLGEALMDEILSRPYDENTPLGGVPACDEVGAPGCSTTLGGDGEAGRNQFNDVDDYNAYCNGTDRFAIVDSLGNIATGGGNQLQDFDRFQMTICVNYDGNADGSLDETGATAAERRAKLISIQIFPPNQQPIEFNAYRYNF